jgi:hypothetical protein
VVADGATINGGGLKAKGGMTISDTGLKISAGLTVLSKGLYVTVGGLSVDATGAKVIGGMTVSNGMKVGTGFSVTSTGMKVASGLCVTSTGLTVTHGINIESGGLTIYGQTNFRYQTSPSSAVTQAYFVNYASGFQYSPSVRRRLGEKSAEQVDHEGSTFDGMENDVGPLTHSSYLRRMLMINADANKDEADKDSFNYSLQDITHYLMKADLRANQFEIDIEELKEVIENTQDELQRLIIRLERLEEKITQ